MSLMEMSEMVSLPIVLVAGFVLVIVLALFMAMRNKETTYEDVIRERDRRLGDSSEGDKEKNLKAARKKATHKARKPDSNLAPLTQSDPTVGSETNTSEEEVAPNPSSPKAPAKIKKSKLKQAPETASLPPDFASVEEITISTESPPLTQVSESLPLHSEPNSDGFEEVSGRKKNRNKPKKTKEEVPVGDQNGDIDWAETNGHGSHDSDQIYFLTTELNRATADKNEANHCSETLRVEVRSKNSEIQKLRSDLQASTLQSDQQISTLKKDNTRLKTQNQTHAAQAQTHAAQAQAHAAQAQTHSHMQEELDKRKNTIDTLKSQNANYRAQFDTQVQQMKATIDKKEVERARILHDRDATQTKLNEANASIAELTTNCKKLERQGREAAANNSTPDAALERSLAEKTAELTSLEEKSAMVKQAFESELNKRLLTISGLESSLSRVQVETPVQSSDSSDEVRELQGKVSAYEIQIEDLTRGLNEWEETVSTLQNEMSSLRTENSSDGDAEQLRRDLAEKETEILNLTALVESAHEELKSVGDMKSEFAELRRQAEDLQSENELLQDRSSDLQVDSSVAELASRHAILQASISQYEDELKESQEKNEAVRTDLEIFEKKIQEKDTELTSSKDEHKVIQETLDKFKQKNNELRESVWKMNDTVQKAEKLAEEETRTVQYKVEDFLGKIFPNIRAFGEDFDDWMGKMKTSATDYLSKLEENKSSSEPESELKERVRELMEKDQIQTQENEKLKDTIRDTEAEVLMLQSQVEEEFDKLKSTLMTEQQAASEKEVIIEEKDSKLNESVKHLETLSQENTTLKQSVVPELEKSLKHKEGEIHELTYQVDSISKKTAKLEDDLASSMRQSFDTDELTSTLQAENDSLSGLSEINQSYKKELAEAKELIRTLQADRPSKQAENGEVEGKDVSKLEAELESLKQDNDLLQQRLREMETQTEEAANNNNNNNDVKSPKTKKKSGGLFKKKTASTTEL